MKFETMIECIDENCRTVIVARNTDGLRCVRCGGRTRAMPFKQKEHDKSNELTIQVNVDNTKALEGIKEVTEATNECVAALTKLETVMGKFTGQTSTVESYCDGKLVAQSSVKHTPDSIKISANDIQAGLVLNGRVTAESLLRNIKASCVLKERF